VRKLLEIKREKMIPDLPMLPVEEARWTALSKVRRSGSRGLSSVGSDLGAVFWERDCSQVIITNT
jgi:hypothetical protein